MMVGYYTSIAQVTVVPKLFRGGDVLTKQYGITSHITWDGYDYDCYRDNLKAIADCGIDEIRFDFNYNTINWGKPNVNFSRWDLVSTEALRNGLTISPIFSPTRQMQYTTAFSDDYKAFINKCVERYGANIHLWEVWNEMEQMYAEDGMMPPTEYLLMLKDAFQTVKSSGSNNIVMMGAIGDFGKPYFKDLLELNADDYCDVLSVHYYSAKEIPEKILKFYGQLSETLNKYSVDKPIWLTETGYSTYNDATDPDLFYTQVLPRLYEDLGINIRKTTLSVLCPPRSSLTIFNQDNLNICYGFNKCESVRLEDLMTLNVETNPVLMVLYGEKFPTVYFDDLRSYIARGGTVVFPEGGAVLYYDWNIETNTIKGVGKDYYRALHIDYVFSWDEEGKAIELNKKPARQINTGAYDNGYQWPEEELKSVKLLSGKNLNEGDQLLPLVEWTDGSHKGPIAACFNLNSDLKGNVIIQTRHNNSHRISERLQADRTPRLFILSFASGVDKVFYYCLRERLKNGGYGIIHSDYSLKPVYETMKVFLRNAQVAPHGQLLII